MNDAYLAEGMLNPRPAMRLGWRREWIALQAAQQY